jgi:hypothetical protein
MKAGTTLGTMCLGNFGGTQSATQCSAMLCEQKQTALRCLKSQINFRHEVLITGPIMQPSSLQSADCERHRYARDRDPSQN